MRVTNDAMANAGKPTSTIVKTIAVGESRVKPMAMYKMLPMYLPSGSEFF